jgi:hypothetical protein
LPGPRSISSERRSWIVALSTVGVLVGLAFVLRDYSAAGRAEVRPVVIAGSTFLPPEVARDSGRMLWERSLGLDELLSRRGFDVPASSEERRGCSDGPGLAQGGHGSVLLLASTRWGRLAEIPGKGMTVLAETEAASLARPGRCVRLQRMNGVH